MKQTLCEYIAWDGLPIIRKEIAVRLVNDHGLSKTKTAEILGISVAAVSQYLSGKRAKKIIKDKKICIEIDKSAERIIKQGDVAIATEICRLCKIFSSKKIFPFISDLSKDYSV